jgi:hypothetical protein
MALGCGTAERVLLIPFAEFDGWPDDMWTIEREDLTYWHVVIYRERARLAMHRKKGAERVDVTGLLVRAGNGD